MSDRRRASFCIIQPSRLFAESLEARAYCAATLLSGSRTLLPTADAYVQGGASSNAHFGAASQLLVKTADASHTRRSYLKFDLTDAPLVVSAVLTLTGGETPVVSEPSVDVALYGVPSSNWSEAGISYSDAPRAFGSPLAIGHVKGTTRRQYEFNLTSYLQQQQTLGATQVTIEVAAPHSTATPVAFASREAGTAGPHLKIVTAAVPSKSIIWSPTAPSPVTRAEAIGAAVGGKVYVFGGFENRGSQNTRIPLRARSDVYDPATNTWKQLKDMPEPFSHAEGAVDGDTIWFVGGYVGDHPGPGTTAVTKYDTLTDTWSNGPSLPQARGAGACAVVGRTLVFSGGMDRTRTINTPQCWALNLDNLKAGWVRMADMPTPRNHLGGAAVGGAFYAIGGQLGQEAAANVRNEVDRFDLATNTWTRVADLPTPRSHITSATFAYEGKIYVIGGETKAFTQQKSVYVYDPTTNVWSAIDDLPLPRSTMIAGVVAGKIVTVTGNSPGVGGSVEGWIGRLM